MKILPLAISSLLVTASVNAGPATAKDASGIRPEILQLTPPSLRLAEVQLADKENAYAVWKEAIEKFVEPGDWGDLDAVLGAIGDGGSLPPLPLARVREWLRKNRQASVLFNVGLRMGSIQYPSHDSGWNHSLSFLDIARLLNAEIVLDITVKNYRHAAQQCLRMLKAGEILERGHGGGLSRHNRGLSILTVSLERMRSLADEKGAPPVALLKLIEALGPTPRKHPQLARAIREEFRETFLVFLDSVWRPANSKVTNPDHGMSAVLQSARDSLNARDREIFVRYEEPLMKMANLIDAKETVAMVTPFYSRAIRSASGPWSDRDKRLRRDVGRFCQPLDISAEKLRTEIEQWSAEMAKQRREPSPKDLLSLASSLENSFGRMLAKFSLPPLDSAVRRSFTANANREATRTCIAARLYILRTGRTPQNLQVLIDEDFLQDLPRDSFSDRSLRYSAKRALLWSVGPDGKDERGERGQNGCWDDVPGDIVWDMPSAE